MKPILRLDLGRPPRSDNWGRRQHYRVQKQEAEQYGLRVSAARRDQQFRVPTENTRRRVVFHWSGPSKDVPDYDRALAGLASTVTDHLKRGRRKKSKADGKFHWVPGRIPILWDDDPVHCVMDYKPWPGVSDRSRLVVLVYEEAPIGRYTEAPEHEALMEQIAVLARIADIAAQGFNCMECYVNKCDPSHQEQIALALGLAGYEIPE